MTDNSFYKSGKKKIKDDLNTSDRMYNDWSTKSLYEPKLSPLKLS